MSNKAKSLTEAYNRIAPKCQPIVDSIVAEMKDMLADYLYVDRVYGRVKSKASFLRKVQQNPTKYDPPFAQVEDFVAVRVLILFPDTADTIASLVREQFHPNVEDYYKEPLEPDKFGYEGHQLIQSIPRDKLIKDEDDYPRVFEIQIKTLLMHAWAEVNHLICYERERLSVELPRQVKRKLSWIAASAWGSDVIMAELRQWHESE